MKKQTLRRNFDPTADRDAHARRAPRTWPRYMTARVAADYCDTSPWTIRRHIEPCGRRGRAFIYAIETVETWMRGTAFRNASDSPADRGTQTGHADELA